MNGSQWGEVSILHLYRDGNNGRGRSLVTLPSVSTLSLTLPILSVAWVTPALSTIQIQFYQPQHALCQHQDTTLHHSITTLDVRLASNDAHLWETKLGSVLAAAIKLRTLVVLSSMQPYLCRGNVGNRVYIVVHED